MLQKPSNHRAHADVVSHSRHLGGQHAGPPHNQIDARTALPGEDQRAHEPLICQGVHLGHDPGFFTTACRQTHALDFFDHAAVQMERRQHELAQLGRPVLAGQMIENTIHVGRGFFVGREVAQVGIQLGCAHVVVAGGQVSITA